MFKLEADFSEADLTNWIEQDLKVWFDDMTKTLMDTAKKQIDIAINKVSGSGYGKVFGNITFNLRSSMGCGLVIDGEVKQYYFPFSKIVDEGYTHGVNLLESLAKENPEDIQVILVAGEYYSVFVQVKGYDVDKMSYHTFTENFLSKLSNG